MCIEGYLKGFLSFPKGKYSSNPLPKSITTWINYWLCKALSRCAKPCTKNEQLGCKNIIFEIKKGSQSFEAEKNNQGKSELAQMCKSPDNIKLLAISNSKFKQINNIWLTESWGHL